ncbi:hypothetical protein [Coprococcus sp. OM04-5BH]|uniref:hypothetical protein n=1 Tax=Coprococcus sp. OM04-5BH TaxID=2293093 RepID=UPI0011C22C52|nr:hypothetical protein [Coprococcus sp. OM04-5BH]
MRHLFNLKQLNNMSKLIAVVLAVVLVLWYPVSVVKAASDDETVITSSGKMTWQMPHLLLRQETWMSHRETEIS